MLAKYGIRRRCIGFFYQESTKIQIVTNFLQKNAKEPMRLIQDHRRLSLLFALFHKSRPVSSGGKRCDRPVRSWNCRPTMPRPDFDPHSYDCLKLGIDAQVKDDVPFISRNLSSSLKLFDVRGSAPKTHGIRAKKGAGNSRPFYPQRSRPSDPAVSYGVCNCPTGITCLTWPGGVQSNRAAAPPECS